MKVIVLASTFLLVFCGSGKTSGKYAGTYKCSGLYESLEFRSGNNVVVKAMGISFPTTYTVSGNYLYIKHDKGGNLSYKIKGKALIGEGYAKGKCRKKK